MRLKAESPSWGSAFYYLKHACPSLGAYGMTGPRFDPKKELTLSHWVAVMEAGLTRYPVGELVPPSDQKGPRLVLTTTTTTTTTTITTTTTTTTTVKCAAYNLSASIFSNVQYAEDVRIHEES